MSKKIVVLKGPVFTQSGYGVHSRQIARWLLSRDDIELIVVPTKWGSTPWLLDREMHNGLIGELMERCKKEFPFADLSFQVQLPDEWDPKLAAKNIGVSAWVETDVCNPKWIERANKMSELIVPSQHVSNVIRETASITGQIVSPRIHVIGESFPDFGEIDCTPFQFTTSFNFLVFGQLTGNSPETDRKNTYATIKWLCEVFDDDPDVGIVIKTNFGRDSKIDRLQTRKTFSNLLAQVRKSQYPKIQLLHGRLSETELHALYTHESTKALVSFTRGEGFGLPILEAAACGLPVIATNWSGHLDFLTKGQFVGVDYTLIPLPKSRIDGRIFAQGARWAEVKEDDAKSKLRRFRKKPDIPTLKWASALRERVKKDFSFNVISQLYDQLFEELK